MFRNAAWKAARPLLLPVSTAAFLLGNDSSWFQTTTHRTVTRLEAAPENAPHLARWKNRWDTGNTRWHKAAVHPSLLQFVDSHLLLVSSPTSKASSEGARVLVPLCGKTADLAYLASHDRVATVVGVEGIEKAIEEFASEHPDLHLKKQQSSVTERFEQWIGTKIVLLKGDFFELASHITARKTDARCFQAVWDRAALVAVNPADRSAYVKTLGNVLAPGGVILLSTFIRPDGDTEKGPPFSIDEDQVRRLFENQPWVESIQVVKAQSALWQEPWYKILSMYYRMGNITEKVFVIKAKPL